MDQRLLRQLLLSALLFSAGSAWAGEGVIEISQAGIVAAGGFPYLITQPGSYRLTSNLDLSVAADPLNTHAIFVQVSGVTVDLAGFSILGTNSCTYDPSPPSFACSATGSGVGVAIGPRDVILRNGTIRGMGSAGIQCNGGCTVDSVAVSESPGGIVLKSGSVVRDSTAKLTSWGFHLTENVTLERCTAYQGGTGIVAYQSTIRGASVGYQTVVGMQLYRSVVDSSTASNNHAVGIDGSSSRVWGNTLAFNEGLGLQLDGNSGWGANVLYDNNSGGVQATGGVQLAPNLCQGATCP